MADFTVTVVENPAPEVIVELAIGTGPQGEQGPPGADGAPGAAGPGLPTGGTAGQVPVKSSGTDYATAWGNHNDLAGLTTGDPHTQYQQESEKDQNSGYAGLNSSGRVPVARLASGTPDGTKFIKDDGTLAVPPGTGAGATRRFLNLGNVTATSTPGSSLYVGATFRPTMDGLTLKGVRFRDASNVNGVSYTLYLYNITSGVVSVASKTFTGNGTFQEVDFDTPQALTSGQIYELGFGTASATNIRYSGTSGNNIASGTVTEDFLGTSSGTLSTASNGTTGRTTGAAVAPNIRMEYTVA